MASQLDLYIEEGTRSEATDSVEMTILAELTQRDHGVSDGSISRQEQAKSAEELSYALSADEAALVSPGETLLTSGKRVIRSGWDCASNWWLSLIAFLLFLQLCLRD